MALQLQIAVRSFQNKSTAKYGFRIQIQRQADVRKCKIGYEACRFKTPRLLLGRKGSYNTTHVTRNNNGSSQESNR
jgi:hypothetical protein